MRAIPCLNMNARGAVFWGLLFGLSSIRMVFLTLLMSWRDDRVAEGAPLLREYRSKAYQGFESLSLRHLDREIKTTHNINL